MSPCIGVCKLDENKVWLGWFRTLNEIVETGRRYAKKEKENHSQKLSQCPKG